LAADVKGRGRLCGFDAEARGFLLEATAGIPTLHAVASRAEPHPEIPGLWVLRATVRELDECTASSKR